MSVREKILIIKLSAFGDFILSLRSFQAIRAHHPHAHLSLLTRAPFVTLAQNSGLFDAIQTDEAPRGLQIIRWVRLWRWLTTNRFDRVYDLQRNDRSACYFYLSRLCGGPRAQWVGKVRGCSHRQIIPAGTVSLVTTREDQQLALVGIKNNPHPDMSFIQADLSVFRLPERFAVLVPGGAVHRPDKRWPVAQFIELAQQISRKMAVVVLGTAAEQQVCSRLAQACAGVINLCGQTSLEQIAVLGRAACFAVGNDTGPMHMLSTNGCAVLVLYSKASNPQKIRPLGPCVTVHQVDDLSALGVQEVLNRIPFPVQDVP